MKKKRRSFKHRKVLFSLFTIFLLVFICCGLYFLVTQSGYLRTIKELDTFPISYEVNSDYLHIRTDRSYIPLGSSYTLYVNRRLNTPVGYTGNLEIKGSLCDANALNCKSYQGPWKNYNGSLVYVSNGIVTINIPYNSPKMYNSIKFRPLNSSYNWSNEVSFGIGTYAGLQNAKDYWNITSSSVTNFRGFNYAFSGTPQFTAKIYYKGPFSKYDPIKRVTYSNVYTQYFTKDNDYGYWLPKTPWYNNRDYDSDFIWDIVYYGNANNSQLKDNFLIALGGVQFKASYSGVSPFSYVYRTMKFGSYDNKFAGYELTPSYVGSGYGFANSKQVYAKRDYRSVTQSYSYLDLVPTTDSFWALHGDVLNLVIKGKNGQTTYNGPALRYKYYEGDDGFVNANKEVLREDYWLIKGKGIVQIDVKNFGSYGRDGIKKYNCTEDPDCLRNEVIQNPHMRMISSEYYY